MMAVLQWCLGASSCCTELSLLLYRAELASEGDTDSQCACGMVFVMYLHLNQTRTIAKHQGKIGKGSLLTLLYTLF